MRTGAAGVNFKSADERYAAMQGAQNARTQNLRNVASNFPKPLPSTVMRQANGATGGVMIGQGTENPAVVSVFGTASARDGRRPMNGVTPAIARNDINTRSIEGAQAQFVGLPGARPDGALPGAPVASPFRAAQPRRPTPDAQGASAAEAETGYPKKRRA